MIAVNTRSARYIGIGRLAPRGAWSLASGGHPFHELIVVRRGRKQVTLGGRDFEVREGDVLWYPAGIAHRESCAAGDPVRTYFIAFRWSVRNDALPWRQHDENGRIALLAGWLYALRERDPRDPAGRQRAFFHAILSEYTGLASAREASLVARVRQFMHENLARPLTLDSLAAVAGLSRYHFVRHYRRLSGYTPMADLRRIRLVAARDLLLTTHAPLKAIAAQTGLGNEYHLSRLFKRQFDVPPSVLRRGAGD